MRSAVQAALEGLFQLVQKVQRFNGSKRFHIHSLQFFHHFAGHCRGIVLLQGVKIHLLYLVFGDPTRRGILDPKALDLAARAELIRQNPAYGQIICRCESVTEGEIIDAIRRTPGARSLDGVKRRTRAGMGRCQAGFCSPRVMEILARELGVPQSEITKSGGASKIIVGTNKDSL